MSASRVRLSPGNASQVGVVALLRRLPSALSCSVRLAGMNRICAIALLLAAVGCGSRAPRPGSDLGPPDPRWLRARTELSIFNHTATLLNDGSVLLVGGSDVGKATLTPNARVLRYDPRSDALQEEERVAHARHSHQAVKLNDGRVMVLGGCKWGTRKVEIFDPRKAGSRWSIAPEVDYHACAASAVTLPSGQVLLAYGDSFFPPKPIQLFDPQTNSWRAVATPAQGRGEAGMFATGAGRAVAFGGGGVHVDQIEPSTNKVSVVGQLGCLRVGQLSGIQVSDTVYWAIGGSGDDCPASPGSRSYDAERFDLATGESKFVALGARYRYSRAVRLTSGRIVIFGGNVGTKGDCREAGYLDLDSTYHALPKMPFGRCFGFTATLLDDGTVLLIGGARSDPLAHLSSEIVRFHPNGL